ncbi:hypothetical protein ASZ90_000441 [hydrocarbon metagenome]|uniref:Uncharacterized protein n=1 Tax=hydrocarbon metagenome TaxID=938273 RepID=A0A0W8G942_9ZZZZ
MKSTIHGFAPRNGAIPAIAAKSPALAVFRASFDPLFHDPWNGRSGAPDPAPGTVKKASIKHRIFSMPYRRRPSGGATFFARPRPPARGLL